MLKNSQTLFYELYLKDNNGFKPIPVLINKVYSRRFVLVDNISGREKGDSATALDNVYRFASRITGNFRLYEVIKLLLLHAQYNSRLPETQFMFHISL